MTAFFQEPPTRVGGEEARLMVRFITRVEPRHDEDFRDLVRVVCNRTIAYFAR